MRPARSGCLNCQWLPRTATRTQPSRSSSRISLRLSRSTPIQCVVYYTTGPVPHRVFRAQSGGDHTPTRDEEPNRPGAPQRDTGRPHRGNRARSPTSSSSTTRALPGAPRTLQRGRRRPGQPVLSPAEARKLLESIGTGALAGLRDRALLSVMLYSFARVSAVLGMRRQDYFGQGSRGWPPGPPPGRGCPRRLRRVGRARGAEGGALPDLGPRGAPADGPGARAPGRPGDDQAARLGRGAAALDVLPHVPGDGASNMVRLSHRDAAGPA